MTFLINSPDRNSTSAAIALTSFDDAELSALPYQSQDSDAGLRQGPSDIYRAWGKRLFDVALGSMMLLAAAPVILLLLLIVSLDGGRPIFAHRRVGQGGRPFGCLKIRSMHMNAEEQLAAILASDPVAAAEWAADSKLSNDPRVTRIGAFLRKSSLDELPQLVNVLRGEMSLVGPRPITADELPRYGEATAGYLAMKPGLTGPWQVDGRNYISYDARVALDVEYARVFGFCRDFDIVLRTSLSVLKLTGK